MNDHPNHQKFQVIFRWLLSAAFLMLLAILASGYWSLSGHLKIVYRAGQGLPPRLERFAPNETDIITGHAADGTGGEFRLITRTPTSFNVKTHRSYAKATVKVTYQNPDNQPEIQLGAEQKNGISIFKTLATNDPILDAVPDYWTVIREGDQILAQKDTTKAQANYQLRKTTDDISYLKEQITTLTTALENIDDKSPSAQTAKSQITQNQTQIAILTKTQNDLESRIAESNARPTYASIADFLKQLPEYSKIATLDYDLTKYLRIADYQPSSTGTIIEQTLRGSHTISTYIKNEPLNFTFTLQELNQAAGIDDATIEVWQADKKVYSTSVPDDGNISANGVISAEKKVAVVVPGLLEGIYQVRINIKNNDMLIRRIGTTQHLLTFVGHLYLVDNAVYHDIIPDITQKATTVYGGGEVFSFTAKEPTGQQTVTVDDEQVTVKLPNVEYSTKTTNWPTGLKQVTIPVNDIYVNSDAGLSFSQTEYFDQSLGLTITPKLDSIDDRDFVIANYPKADTVNGWEVASQTFVAPFVYTNSQDRIRFSLNFPGLNENNRVVKIKQIEIDLYRDPVTVSKIWHKFIKLLKRA